MKSMTRNLNWAALLSWATAFVAVGSAVLHLVGTIWHRTYLGYWGVDADLFPQATHQVLISGFYAVFERSLAFLVTLVESWHFVCLIAISLVLFIYLVDRVSDWGVDLISAVVRQAPGWSLPVIKSVLLGVLAAAFAIVAALVLVAVMAVPALVSENAATKSAERHAADFRKGCDASTARCVVIRRPSKPAIVGYLLSSSPTQLAVYDVATKQSMTFAREGAEVLGTPRRSMWTDPSER